MELFKGEKTGEKSWKNISIWVLPWNVIRCNNTGKLNYVLMYKTLTRYPTHIIFVISIYRIKNGFAILPFDDGGQQNVKLTY